MSSKKEGLKEVLKSTAIAGILALGFLGIVELSVRIDALANPQTIDSLKDISLWRLFLVPHAFTSFYLNNEPSSALTTAVLGWGAASHVLRTVYRANSS